VPLGELALDFFELLFAFLKGAISKERKREIG